MVSNPKISTIFIAIDGFSRDTRGNCNSTPILGVPEFDTSTTYLKILHSRRTRHPLPKNPPNHPTCQLLVWFSLDLFLVMLCVVDYIGWKTNFAHHKQNCYIRNLAVHAGINLSSVRYPT